MLAILGFLLVLGGPVAYLLLIGNALLRSTGLPAFGLMAAGLIAGFAAARGKGRRAAKVGFVLEVVLVGAFLYGFFVWARLPEPATAGFKLERAPDFTLPDTEGRPVRLVDELAKGPVLLVFFRGHW